MLRNFRYKKDFLCDKIGRRIFDIQTHLSQEVIDQTEKTIWENVHKNSQSITVSEEFFFGSSPKHSRNSLLKSRNLSIY